MVHSCSAVFFFQDEIHNNWKLKTTSWKTRLNQLTWQICTLTLTFKSLLLFCHSVLLLCWCSDNRKSVATTWFKICEAIVQFITCRLLWVASLFALGFFFNKRSSFCISVYIYVKVIDIWIVTITCVARYISMSIYNFVCYGMKRA
jgi:hypothetical protein